MTAPRRLRGGWLLLLLLPAVACSLTLNVNQLSEGCAEGLVLCNGECVADAACALTSGGAGGAAGAAGGNGGIANAGSLAGGASGSGGEGGVAGPCSISFPFAYDPPGEVTTVHVSGDFIGWNKPGIEMLDDGSGVYRVVVDDLPQGKVIYKFAINYGLDNEAWQQDPNNPDSEPDGILGRNSILMLECGVDYVGEGGAGGAGGVGGAGGSQNASGAAGAAGAAGAGGTN